MRPPVLLLLAIGRSPFIPLPLFLLWPFVGLAWLVVLLCLPLVPAGRSASSWLATARQAFVAFGHLPGLRVEVQSQDGVDFNLWIV